VHHPSGIPQKIVDKVVARRGRLHAFESLTAQTTALVVIDLDDASVYRIFGDVRPSAEIIGLLHAGHQALLHPTARNSQ
jgi:hypothetical protein